MAEQKNAAPAAAPAQTEYVVEHSPKLPSLNTSVQRGEPVIDTDLVKARDAEAKAAADRLKG